MLSKMISLLNHKQDTPISVHDATEPEDNSSVATDLARLSNLVNKSRCDSVSHDLPIMNSHFIGREVEMAMILQQINIAHIINVNGAPGFGKSLLAIHTGYQMVQRGSTVRYIDAADKFTACKFDITESTPTHSQELEQTTQASNTFSLIQKSQSAIMKKTPFKNEWKKESTDTILKDLLAWSKALYCPTMLILDNCDDLIYSDTTQESLIQLMKQMIQNSKNQLHIIVTSRQQLYILDDFESLVIKELTKVASVNLLQLLAPNISADHSEVVASLIEGCPLALKVVGMLLHKQEDRLTEILQEELLKHPIKVLNKTSIQKERFGAIMDVVYKQLGSMQECGYYISLFPGSFSHQAGTEVIPMSHCLDTFERQSLFDKYSVGNPENQTQNHQTRYKMHRLIREYFREKNTTNTHKDLQQDFEDRYCKYFADYIYKSMEEISEEQQYFYSLETHNIHHFLHLLLRKSVHSTKELTILAHAVGEKLLSVNLVQSLFRQMMEAIRDICHDTIIIRHRKCGELFSFIISQLYHECKCKNTYDYITQVLSCRCMDLFKCTTVAEINQHPHIRARLNKQVKNFLFRLNEYHCESLLGMKSSIRSLAFHTILSLCEFLLFMWFIFEFFTYRSWLIVILSARLAFMLYYIFHALNREWMEWLTDYFPLFVLQLKKLVMYVLLILYLCLCTRYIFKLYRFIPLLIQGTLAQLYHLTVDDYHIYLFMLIIGADQIFDIFIFFRFVPVC